MNGEKPHVFREATKEVAFRNTCGFWTDYLWADNRRLAAATFGSTHPSGMTRPYPRNPSGFQRYGCPWGSAGKPDAAGSALPADTRGSADTPGSAGTGEAPAGTGSSPAGAAGSAGSPAPGTRLPEAEHPGGSGHRVGTGILRGTGRPRSPGSGIPAGSGGTQGPAEEPADTRVLPDLPSPGSLRGAAG